VININATLREKRAVDRAHENVSQKMRRSHENKF